MLQPSSIVEGGWVLGGCWPGFPATVYTNYMVMTVNGVMFNTGVWTDIVGVLATVASSSTLGSGPISS